MIWIIWLLIIVGDAWFNHWRESKGGINHYVNGSYRFAIAVILLWIFGIHGWQRFFFITGGFFSFWLFFNLALNKLDGRKLFGLGTTSVLDRPETRYPNIAWPFWKFVLAFISVVAYYLN